MKEWHGLNTKKKNDSQKKEEIFYLDEDVVEFCEPEDEPLDLSYLNQPTLVVVKNKNRKRRKHAWAVPI